MDKVQVQVQLQPDGEISEVEMRRVISAIAIMKDEYAGLPMPIHEEHLVIHPKYRFAPAFARPPEPEDLGFELVNKWWSHRFHRDVMVWRENGKLMHGVLRSPNQAKLQLHTLGVAQAWTMEAETKAIMKLGGLLKPHSMHQYALTGSFMETSPRSKITYCFRRLRPTLALSMSNDNPQVLCALCLHPIGYYEGTWAGAMCPTDEVIAHLMLMRGDEHDFWKQANQHPAWRPEAGL